MKKACRAPSVFLALLGWIGAAGPSHAQTIRGTLTGTVTDPMGAVVARVTVTVVNPATGLGGSAVTNQQGIYTFPMLPPGAYQVKVEEAGFKKLVRTGVAVQIAQTTRLDIALQVGEMSEEIQVAGEGPHIGSRRDGDAHVEVEQRTLRPGSQNVER